MGRSILQLCIVPFIGLGFRVPGNSPFPLSYVGNRLFTLGWPRSFKVLVIGCLVYGLLFRLRAGNLPCYVTDPSNDHMFGVPTSTVAHRLHFCSLSLHSKTLSLNLSPEP